MIQTGSKSAEMKNVKLVGYSDLSGWGDAFQVWVRDKWCYVGASGLNGHEGTTVLDVEDPSNPKVVTQISAPPGTHSHKVQFLDDVMIVNAEMIRDWDGENFVGGLRLFDVSNPGNPKFIKDFPMHGRGTHRHIVDSRNRLCYCTCPERGYRGNIVWILDIDDPTNPEIVGKCFLEMQCLQEGEEFNGLDVHLRVHQANRRGNYLFCGCSDYGVVIFDVRDPANPQQVGQFNPTPPYPGHCHTALPLPDSDLVIVTHESTSFEVNEAPGFLWIYDGRVVSNPVPISTWMPYPVDPVTLYPREGDWATRGGRYGAHNVWEGMTSKDFVYVVWFNAGLRIVDISDPYQPREVGYYIPEGGYGRPTPQSNDVFVDERGLIYISDRWGLGLHIIEYTG